MLTPVRIGWLVLAGLAAAFSAFVAHEPMWQITSCELGVFGDDGIDNSAECDASILAHYGPGVLFVLAIPVVLCVGPAVVPTRLIAWAVTTLLLACCFVSLFTSTTLTIYVYYAPIALAAVVLAAFHGHLTRLGSRFVVR